MWRVQDVTGWAVLGEEPRGIREKRWLVAREDTDVPAGSRWLWKLPRSSRPCEPAVEVFALGLARRVGIPAAQAYLARSLDGRDEQRGVVVRSFIDAEDVHDDGRATKQSLAVGWSLLSGMDHSYSPSDRPSHTLARVRAALARSSDASEARTRFAHMLCFDAWIGNGDRHQGNWGLVEERDGFRALSPMFDPASCLGAELQSGHALLDPRRRTDERLDQYIFRCPSGFGDGAALVPMTNVVRELQAAWPEWTLHVDAWLARFSDALAHDVPGTMTAAPDAWWPSSWRELARALLERRLRLLHGLQKGVPS